MLHEIFDNVLTCCKDLYPCAKQPLYIPGQRHQLEELLQSQTCGSVQLYELLYTRLYHINGYLQGGEISETCSQQTSTGAMTDCSTELPS